MVLVLLWSLPGYASLSHTEAVQTAVLNSKRERREALQPYGNFKYSLHGELYGL